MDNFHIDITSEGKESFHKALSLCPHSKVYGYRVGDNELILYWTSCDKSIALPYPMTIAQAAEFAYGWLEHADYPQEPDHDGDNGKGWRMYCDKWGRVDGEWQAFIAIQPVWAMYGK